MATTIRPAFVRPVEHVQHSSGIDFSIGANDYAVSSGVYQTISDLFAAVSGETTEFDSIVMSDDLKLGFALSSSATVSWTNTNLRDALGFDDDVICTAYQYEYATYTPSSVWVPEFHFADQRAWGGDGPRRFIGAVAVNGSIAGMGTGDACKDRQHIFNHELAVNLGREFCSTQEAIDRCLDEFVNAAIESVPEVSSHPCTKGFWYFQDVNHFIATVAAGGTGSVDKGIDFGISDQMVFCNFDPSRRPSWRDAPSLPVGRIRYTVTCDFHTAPAGNFIYQSE